ncbi:hypothetical protein JCM10908_001884 [Rhodotorula pacifica]|uniref:uncharacterized protein n=1 Tax=Rhodotorula pacifica TaxID=1495444 RepID=UPI0031817CDE
MSDGRYTWVQMPLGRAMHLLDDEDEDDHDWELPDDDIYVPAHLLPPYQDEDDETALPSQTHPSYPYGNPYKPNAFTSPGRGRPASSSHLSTFAHPLTHSASLATSLPALELRQLFERTTFGDPSDRQWAELNLPGLFGPKTRIELDEDRKSRDAMYNAHGDAGPPAGQNAADGGGGGGAGQESVDGEEEEAAGRAIPPGEAAQGEGVARTQEEVREVVTGEPMHDDSD